MNIKITPSALYGETEVISSKSFAHRALILSVLSGNKVTIKNLRMNDDIEATMGCLANMGCSFERLKGNIVKVKKERLSLRKDCVMNCRESGSTLRFLLPVAAALSMPVRLSGSKRLLNRPISELTDALTTHGVSTSFSDEGIELSGRLSGGDFELSGSVSSQYISGLLMALPLTGAACRIKITGRLVSRGYINLTVYMMSLFGVKVEETGDSFYIAARQEYKAPKTITVESDWSNAAFLLAAGALCGNVTVKGLSQDSMQGDKEIFYLLKKMGCYVYEKKSGITAKKSDLYAIKCDVEDIPDLTPVLTVLAANAKGISVFTGVSRLREKECDRLAAIQEISSIMGGKSEYRIEEDALYITGTGLKGSTLSSYNDHRMIMAATVAALAAKGDSVMTGTYAVNKSYPGFFDAIKSLGAKISGGESND